MIITIGREYGSGGREIGRLVAQKLGIPFYDKEILTRAAEESGLCHELFEHHDEKASVGGMITGTGSGVHVGAANVGLQMPLNQRVFLAQFDAISKIAAEEGSCVIVGRCADYVLKDLPHVTHVFIFASTEKRIERIMRVENVNRDKARDLIKKTDKQRKNYYNFFADGNWGLRSNYDLMIRTDDKDFENIADAIIAYAKLND